VRHEGMGSREIPMPFASCFKESRFGGLPMKRLLGALAITVAAGSLFSPNPTAAQILPPQKRAEHVEITKAPTLEIAYEDVAIVQWTTTNPRGDDEHYAVAHFGTNPKELYQTAKSHIRLNRGHAETIFRVRIAGLKPQTTYFYKVTSEDSTGENDGVESAVYQFTMPAPGERIVAP
jgi:hypothetical protein